MMMGGAFSHCDDVLVNVSVALPHGHVRLLEDLRVFFLPQETVGPGPDRPPGHVTVLAQAHVALAADAHPFGIFSFFFFPLWVTVIGVQVVSRSSTQFSFCLKPSPPLPLPRREQTGRVVGVTPRTVQVRLDEPVDPRLPHLRIISRSPTIGAVSISVQQGIELLPLVRRHLFARKPGHGPRNVLIGHVRVAVRLAVCYRLGRKSVTGGYSLAGDVEQAQKGAAGPTETFDCYFVR